MTELLSGVEAPSDAELISRVRGGDVAAYGELFTRHVEAARRLGRQLVRGPDVDDLVSDAFAKTLTVLQNGGGPDVAFRAYLLTSVRRLHVDKIRAAKKVQPADDMTVFDDGVPFQDTAVANFENGAAARAFSSLPERWQLVLWHLEVEGQKPADIAPLLGMSANSVSALAYRAREGLRQAFLTMHLADSPSDDCRWVNEHLGAYVRKGLSKRDTAKVDEHLEGCRRCTAMYLELNEVNSNLAGIIAPLLLGAAAAGYVSSAGGAGLTGVSALFGRVRDAVGGNSAGGTAAAGTGSAVSTGGLVTAGGVIAASVAAVTAAAFVFGGGPAKEVITEADQPVGIVQTPAAPGASGSTDSDSDSDPGDRPAAEDAVAGDATDGSEEAIGDLPVSVSDGSAVEPGGTTDTPTDVTTGDAPAAGPGTEAPGTGGDTVDGPGAAPGDAPTDAPGTDEPGTDTPGTDEPGTDGPATDQPGTDGPGTEPGSGEPSDSPNDSPSDGPSSEPQPRPSPVGSTQLSVNAFDVVDGSVSLSFSNAPANASVLLSATSEPGGVDLAAGGDCTLDPNYPDYLVCSPGGGISGSFLSRVITSALASVDGNSYTVRVPLAIRPDAVDGTTLTVDYLLTDEHAAGVEAGTDERVLRIANVGLTSPAVIAPSHKDGPFNVTGMLSGLPATGTDQVTYTLTGPARFVEQAGTDCLSALEGQSLTCPSPANGPVGFLVVPTDRTVDATASVAVSPISQFIDPEVTNNTITVALPATPDPDPEPGVETPFGIGNTDISEIDGADAQFKRVTITFDGTKPGDVITLTLTGGQTYFCEEADCATGAGDLEDTTRHIDDVILAEDGTFQYEFSIKLPGASRADLLAVLARDGRAEMSDSVALEAPPGGQDDGTGGGVAADRSPKGADEDKTVGTPSSEIGLPGLGRQ